MFRIESGLYRTNGDCTKTRKIISVQYGQSTKIFKSAFYYDYTALNITKLTWVIQMYENIFAIKIVIGWLDMVGRTFSVELCFSPYCVTF